MTIYTAEFTRGQGATHKMAEEFGDASAAHAFVDGCALAFARGLDAERPNAGYRIQVWRYDTRHCEDEVIRDEWTTAGDIHERAFTLHEYRKDQREALPT